VVVGLKKDAYKWYLGLPTTHRQLAPITPLQPVVKNDKIGVPLLDKRWDGGNLNVLST
jgi:hypothetical protein